MKQKFVEYYMRLADETAKLSSAVRLQVGSVIVRDQQILATGYNGTPTGWNNDCEDIELMPYDSIQNLDPTEIWHQWPYQGNFWIDGVFVEKRYRLKTKSEVLHAESNALMKIARSTESSDGAAMFCTHAPCLECAKLIYQSGIKKLYYRDTYRDFSGVEFLQKGNVDVEQYNSNKS